jgi:hypothetical protein
MDIIAFDNITLPYSFSTAATITFKGGVISEGRGGAISRNNSDFYFNFGDVYLNESPVQLKEKNDTVNISNNAQLNYYLETEPFTVNDNSVLDYTISYGVNDSLLAVNELAENESINFRLELIDNSTGLVLGTLKEINQSKTQINANRNVDYRINLSNLANRIVKLRLVEEDNLSNGSYTLLKIHSSGNGLMKSGYNEITLNGEQIITDYALEQNYPNPFNPSTTINYQIPEDGIVSLTIYDILGNEVKTVINEQKSMGRYQITIDAGDLSSGVYIYKIQVNDFVSTKKMMFMK